MASRHLIEAYAANLLDRLGGRATAIAAEVLDHLGESVEQRVADGVPPEIAEHDAIAAFGDLDVVAESFRVARIPMPTAGSGRAGAWLVRGALLVLVALGAMVAAQLVEWRQGWHTVPAMLGTIGCLLLALALMCWMPGLHGLARRVGTPAPRTTAASLLVGVGAVAALLAWFLWGWVTMLVTGFGLILPGVPRSRVGPRWATPMVGVGALCLIAAALLPLVLGWSVTAVLASGFVRVMIGLGVATMAVGLFSLGRFLMYDGAPTTQPAGF